MQGLSFEEIWPYIAGTLSALRQEIEDGIENANRIAETHPELVRDPILWSAHVRAYVANQLPHVIDQGDCGVERGFNISLTLHGEKASVRVLKVQENQMPRADGPGRRLYFDQVPMRGNRYVPNLFSEPQELDHFVLPEGIRPSNFVVLWIGGAGGLVDFRLAYPKSVPPEAAEDARPEWYWSLSVMALTERTLGKNPGTEHEGRSLGLEKLSDERTNDEDEGSISPRAA